MTNAKENSPRLARKSQTSRLVFSDLSEVWPGIRSQKAYSHSSWRCL